MAIQNARSKTAGSTPTTLADGQIAINMVDEVLFYKNNAGAIVSLPMKAVTALLSNVRPLSQGGTGLNAASTAALLTGLGAEQVTNKGVANGYAGLGSDGKIATSLLPAAILGALEYQSTWDASANSPALASGAGTKGSIYVVATAGTTTLDGISQWNVGDWAIFDGTEWRKLDGVASEVLSVAGLVGAITAAALKAALAIAVADVSGLGNAATKNIGAIAGTVAAGDDIRFATSTALAADVAYNGQDIRALYLILSGQTGADRLNGVATVADGFNDQSDVASTSNMTYDGTGHRYAPTPAGYTTVSNSAQAISGGDSGSYPKSNAFDGNISTVWLSSQTGSAVNGAAYIGQDFGSSAAYSIRQIIYTAGPNGTSISSVNVQFSDNGTSWTTATTASLSQTTNAVTTIAVPESGAHRYWKLLAAAASGSTTSWSVAEVNMQTSQPPAVSATLQSVAFPAAPVTNPTKARVLIQVDASSAAFTPNTDLIASVSRDGGTTFTAGTLALVETLADGTTTYETGLIDISGQPSGSSMVWKVATANSKTIVVSGVVLQWRP